MAFLPPEQQNQFAPQGQTTNNPSGMAGTPPPQAGGSSGSGTGAQKAGGTPSGGTPTQFGSSASKLGDYLSANAPQIGQQAQTVTNNLNNQYGQVQGDITNAVNQFGQQVQGGYTAGNQDLVNQAFANPTQFASDPNNVKAFQSQYNDTYSGPQNFESTSPYGNIQNEVNSAVQNAGLLNSQAGLQQYLGQTGKGNQTRASNTLDALLLQGNQGAKQQIQQAAGQFKGLTDQFGNAVQGANQNVTAAQQAADQARQYAQQQAGTATNQFNTQLQDALKQAQNQTSAYNQTIPGFQSGLEALNQGVNNWNNFTNTSWDPNFGFATVGMQNPTSGVDVPQMMNAPTQNQVATQDQLAQQQALNTLLGNNNLNAIDPNSAVGGYNAPTASSLSPYAQQIMDNLTNASNDTYQKWIAPLAGNSHGAQFMQPFNETLQNQVGSLQQLLEQYGATKPGQRQGLGQNQFQRIS